MRPAVTEGMELDGDRELAFVETLGIRNAVRSRGPEPGGANWASPDTEKTVASIVPAVAVRAEASASAAIVMSRGSLTG